MPINNRAHKPLVSVIIPVYNGEKYLHEAIDSILTQTYSNMEVIIINDGSTDRSATVVKSFSDKRIRYYEQSNQGIARALNFGICQSNGEYIARQDADDVSLPNRIERQISFMELHQDYGMVGTWAQIWEESRSTNRYLRHPATNGQLKFELLFDSFFVHSSVVVRKSVFNDVGLYNYEDGRYPEDFELWSRVARKYKVANIPEELHIYREVLGSECRTGINPFQERLVSLCSDNLSFLTNYKFSDDVYRMAAALTHHAWDKMQSGADFLTICEMMHEIANQMENKSEVLGLARKRVIEMAGTYLKFKLGKLGQVIFPFYNIYLRKWFS